MCWPSPLPEPIPQNPQAKGAGLAREMTQQLGALAALPEFKSQYPHGGSQTSVTPVSGDPKSYSGSSWAPGTHTMDTHTHEIRIIKSCFVLFF